LYSFSIFSSLLAGRDFSFSRLFRNSYQKQTHFNRQICPGTEQKPLPVLTITALNFTVHYIPYRIKYNLSRYMLAGELFYDDILSPRYLMTFPSSLFFTATALQLFIRRKKPVGAREYFCIIRRMRERQLRSFNLPVICTSALALIAILHRKSFTA
jgi:hypothetical protein